MNSQPRIVLQLCSYIRSNAFHGRCFEAIAKIGFQQVIVSPHAVPEKNLAKHPLLTLHQTAQPKWPVSRMVIYSWKIRDYAHHLDSTPDSDRVGLVHAHSLYADGLVAFRYSKQQDLPLVITIREGDITVFPKYYPHWRSRARAALEYADKIIFVNHNYRAALEKALDIKLDDTLCTVIPNGADDDWYAPPDPVRTPGPMRKIICVGKLSPRKNQKGLIEGIRIARENSNEEFELDLVGQVIGRYGKEVLTLCARYSWLRYLGTMNQSQLIETYKQYDLLALASHLENFGIVYAEALASGMPILYSAGQGFDGWSETEQYGISVDSHDGESIAKAILELGGSWKSTTNYREFSRSLFSWPVIAKQHEKIYKNYLSVINPETYE